MRASPHAQNPETGAPEPAARGRRARAFLGTAAVMVAMVAAAGCKSAERYAAEADQEVYALIQERRRELFGDRSDFRIEPPEESLRRRLVEGDAEAVDALTIPLCLEVAAETSREFQARRESLYFAALDVTLERWRLGWRYSATAGADVRGTGGEGELATADADLGLDRVLGTGARVLGNIGLGLVRVIGSGGGWDSFGDLGLSITQPLLRGAGRRITLEPLTQAQRSLVYEARSFERFRRTLAVDVADRVYRVLQQMDAVENERANAENLGVIRRRNQALAEAGRLSDIQVDQASQNELRSQNRLLVEEARLEQLLDGLKLFLGLPIEVRIGIDGMVLEELEAGGVTEIRYPEAAVIAFALEHRLDYQTALDRVEDAARRIRVAADALRPGLDLSASALAPSDAGRPLSYDFDDVRWQLALDLDLPVDRLPARNAYRAALISLQAAVRAAEELGDRIRSSLRDDLRVAQTTLESYQIQLNSVALAARRVESARLNLDAGRADTRDILEAQEALLDAQNATTRALVEHFLARLELFLDMELLTVGERGIEIDLARFESASAPDA